MQVELTCIIPHTHFFVYILIFTVSLTFLMMIANLYTLLWILCKPCRKLNSHLALYKLMFHEQHKANDVEWDKNKTALHNDVFGGLNSPDVELMLDLLAETMGIAPSMRILTMLDPELLTSWKVVRSVEVN